MVDWVRIGNRYLNLGNACEVLIDDHGNVARVIFIGGGAVELREDDARDLQAVLAGTETPGVTTHRTIFTMQDA